MRRTVPFLACIAILLAFSGCFAEKHGNDLTALIARINEIYGEEAVKPEGFVVDEEENTAYSFLSCENNKQFLFSTNFDEKHRITACHVIVSEVDISEDESIKNFITTLLIAFTGADSETVTGALNELKVFTTKTQLLDEASIEVQNYKYTYTATELGAVISCEIISKVSYQ